MAGSRSRKLDADFNGKAAGPAADIACLTVAQVAEALRASAAVISRWIKSGELKAVNVSAKLGGHRPSWQIPVSDFEAFFRGRFNEARSRRIGNAKGGEPRRFYLNDAALAAIRPLHLSADRIFPWPHTFVHLDLLKTDSAPRTVLLVLGRDGFKMAGHVQQEQQSSVVQRGSLPV